MGTLQQTCTHTHLTHTCIPMRVCKPMTSTRNQIIQMTNVGQKVVARRVKHRNGGSKSRRMQRGRSLGKMNQQMQLNRAPRVVMNQIIMQCLVTHSLKTPWLLFAPLISSTKPILLPNPMAQFLIAAPVAISCQGA
jgi:hypothetical protein